MHILVAQAFKGTMLYDVLDTGLIKGPAVRADLTRQELSFHTDYSLQRSAAVHRLRLCTLSN